MESFYYSNFYNDLMTRLAQNGTQASTAQELLSRQYEFQRLDSLASRSNIFTSEKFLHRTVIPKKFDRVFSFLISEGDFIPISKHNMINAGEASMSLNESIQALIESNILSGLEGGDMETLGLQYTDFHEASPPIPGVFDEDQHFSDETIYQYYFSILQFGPSFDFQNYRKNSENTIVSEATTTGQEVGGAIALFDDPEVTSTSTSSGLNSKRKGSSNSPGLRSRRRGNSSGRRSRRRGNSSGRRSFLDENNRAEDTGTTTRGKYSNKLKR
jgi:hypothetical protein